MYRVQSYVWSDEFGREMNGSGRGYKSAIKAVKAYLALCHDPTKHDSLDYVIEGATEVSLPPGERGWPRSRVTFADGTRVIVDGDHVSLEKVENVR